MNISINISSDHNLSAPELAMAHTTDPIVYFFKGCHMQVHISAAQTGGNFSLIEVLIPAGADSGLHQHLHEDQTIHLLSGTLEVTIGDQQVTLVAGDSLFAPRNIPHRLQNPANNKARLFMINTPGKFDRLVSTVGVPVDNVEETLEGAPSELYVRRFYETASAFGISFL